MRRRIQLFIVAILLLATGVRAPIHAASGLVELTNGTQIGTTGSNGGSGNDKTKLIDGDLTTFFDSPNSSGDWAGIDAGTAVTVVRTKFAPRRGDSSISSELQYENGAIGCQVQGSSDITFATDINTVDTIPSPLPNYPSLNYNSRATTSPPSKRYWRWVCASTRVELAELRFIANAGPTNAKPVQPVIAPWGGRFLATSPMVTLTSETTSASLYYTTDGSTPTNASTLYSGPFTLSLSSSEVVLKVIAYDASLGTTTSDVSTSYFDPWGLKPNADWYDDRGILVEAHYGGFLTGAKGVPLKVNGYYWWYGDSANRYSNNGTYDGVGLTGIWLYKTTDFLNFTFVGNIIDGAETSQQYYERPHVLFNALNNNYVLWAHNRNIAQTIETAVVATASAPDGPWTVTTTSLNPDGQGMGDFNLFLDDTGTAYVVYTNTAQTAVIVSQLATDFQSANISSVTAIAAQREAPVLVKDHTGAYILITSLTNYYDSSGSMLLKAAFASSPLGTWSALQPIYAADPVGTNFNVQSSIGLMFPNGFLLGGDYGVQNNHYHSRQSWTPVDNLVSEPTTWDISRFQTPSNNLLSGLVAFWPLNEFSGAGAAAVEKIGGLNAATNAGSCPMQGVRLRARDTSSDYFSAANNAVFQTGNIDVWWNVWVYRTGAGSFDTAFSKDDLSTNKEYGLYIATSTDNSFHFYVSPNGTSATEVIASTLGAVPTGQWFMVTCWESFTLGEIGIAINRTVDHTASYSSGIHVGTAGFHIGNTNTVSNWTGYIRSLGMWKAAKPSTAQLSALYNSGLELPYEYFLNAAPTRLGVQCCGS